MARVICPAPGVQLTLMDYPLTDMRTGDTAHAVWEGERDPRNPQRLIRPRFVGVYSKHSDIVTTDKTKDD